MRHIALMLFLSLGVSAMEPVKGVAVLGGGCFWCLEAIFQQVKGVYSVTSGYAGGATPNPTYEEVCSGSTGHAEVVKIEYDPTIISNAELFRLFFHIHDPTTLNRQGNDEGTQYRSIILVKNDSEKAIALRVMGDIIGSRLWKDPVVTTVEILEKFYPAEDYHQNYFEKNPNQGYCRIIIAPKVAKFKKEYPQLFQK